jgi:hypothetical protein
MEEIYNMPAERERLGKVFNRSTTNDESGMYK